MSIIYICDNCGKRFKLQEYMKLDAIYISDDRSAEVVVPKGRKCDSCGKEIVADNKIVERR